MTPLMSEVAVTAPVAGADTEVQPDRPHWVLKRPGLLVFGAYVVLAVIFFWPGLLPGHTVSAADYLWNAAPWNTSIPASVPRQSLHPLLVGSNPQLVDGVTVFEPFLQFTKSQLPHIPLWDPYIMGGAPYLADMQSAIFSPFSLPAYVLPFWWSLGVIAVMKVVVAATGTYLLARALKAGLAGAFLAGLIFGFGLFLIAWIPWPLDNVFPLIPWMLLATERLVRRPGVLPAAGLATLVALQFFGGHPESSVYAIFAVVGYFVLRLLQGAGGGVVDAVREARRHGTSALRALRECVPRPVVAFVLALVVGTALAAIALIPFLELLHNSSDLTARPRSQVHVQVKYAFAAFLPRYFPGSFEIETAFYAGALPLMLGIAALLRPRVERVAFAVVGVASVLVVLGIQPLFALAGHTPGLDETYLSRLTIIYLLCLALLAGWGLDDLVRRRPSRRVAMGIGAAAVVLALVPLVLVAATRGTSLRYLHQAIHIAWLFASTPFPHAPHVVPIVRLTALVVWLTVAGFAVLLLLLRLTRVLGARVFAFLAIALVVGDLFQAGMGYNPAVTQADATQPVTGAITYLQHIGPARYVGVTPYNTTVPLPPDVNVRYGLTDLRGYDLPVISRFGNFWTHYVAPATPLLPQDTPSVPLTVYNTLAPSTMRALSLFGVRDILEQKHEPPPNIPGLRLAYAGSDATIYANPDALPRTWLVGTQEVLPNPGAQLDRIGAASFHPLQAVVTGRRLPGLSTGSAVGPGPGTSRITSYGDERVAITAHASRPGELVLSDTWYPGWQVSVNGRPATVDEVDYLLRGVAVPAGTDHIVFTYDPASFRHGWELSLAAAVVLAATVGGSLLRRRRRGRLEGRHVRSEPGTGPGLTPDGPSSA